jgi:hypothetical protein
MIHTTMYVSTLHDELDGGALEALLQRSRTRNEQSGITGLLIVQGRRVVQMLEGEQHLVRRLYDRIASDPRHHDVITVWDSTTPLRRFPDWSMAFDDLTGPAGPLQQDWAAGPGDAQGSGLPSEDVALARRREAALRRALVSGEQLVVSLAIILQGHRPDLVLTRAGTARLRCAECHDVSDGGRYPCNTARNALWAIESTMPREP